MDKGEKMNRKILITGASRGIGEAIARQFAKESDELYLVCRKQIEKLQKLQQELQDAYGIQVHTFQVDVSNVAEVEKLFKSLPALDVVINNAGISYVGLLTDMSNDEWDHVIATNLSSLFYICKNAVPGMVSRKQGKIINISSVWGNVGASMEVAYSASKGGINSFTKALAKELAPSNIQVNAIACGVIDTQMNACFSKEDMEALIEEIPADRIGQPKDVAMLVSDISKTSDYLTGQIITLDGGWI